MILIHGSGGVGDNHKDWAKVLNKMGIVTFILDSFTSRGISEVYTGAQTIGTGSRIIDVYRAVELLRLSSEASIAAYLAFYPPLWLDLKEFEKVDGRPIRIFVGTSDDWTPSETARIYIEKLQSAGQDAKIHEYPGAHHAFDNPSLGRTIFIRDAMNLSKCHFKETTIGGEWVDPITNETVSRQASCISRGATVEYNAAAHRQAIKDVESFLRTVNSQPGKDR